jgi:DNA primase
MDFLLSLRISKHNTTSTSPIDKQKILNILFGLVQKINNISLQQHYIQVISDKLNSPFEFTRSQYKQFSQNEGKVHSRQKQVISKLYQPSRELLFAALFYNDFFEQHQETPSLWSTFLALKSFFLTLANNPITPLLDTKDQEIIESLNQASTSMGKRIWSQNRRKKNSTYQTNIRTNY